jgi:predicted nucleotidyltransferase
MTQTILNKLEELERKYDVKILYACESGSRAWGFNSKNSDYDVRFIYVHKLPWYLGVNENRDVIEEIEGDLDLSGWELRKSLKLLAKGNPPLLEWLNSPIIYHQDPTFTLELNLLADNCFSAKSAIYHYLNMAKRNYNQYIKDKSYVKLKKYLYVIRPLLSCMAIQDSKSMPPTAMDLSMDLLKPFTAYAEVLALVEAKKAGKELEQGPSNTILNDFIEESLFFFELYVMDIKGVKIDYKALNRLLFSQVLEYTDETR